MVYKEKVRCEPRNQNGRALLTDITHTHLTTNKSPHQKTQKLAVFLIRHNHHKNRGWSCENVLHEKQTRLPFYRSTHGFILFERNEFRADLLQRKHGNYKNKGRLEDFSLSEISKFCVFVVHVQDGLIRQSVLFACCERNI